MRSWFVCLGLVALGACSSKTDGDPQGTAGTTSTTAGTSAGSSGTSGGTGGNGGTEAGSGASGNAALDAGNSDGATAAADGGVDGGSSTPLGCRAPTPATTFGNACPAGDPVELQATKIAGDFNFPVFVTHAPNDPDHRLFVVERFGAIQIVKDGAKLGTPFLQLGDNGVVTSFNEQGLLGMAFDPDYETTGRFWVDYIRSTTFGTESVVESYKVSSNADVADETTKTPLIQFEDAEANHNGGMLAFGPDGCLYVSAGDGGGGDDLHTAHGSDGNGQSLKTELGKMLRIDVDHPDQMVEGNVASADVPWIWDLGLRNPWRFSFDRKTGDMYIGDVGQDQWEEINVEPRGHGKNNYGWRFTEGKHCRGETGAPGSCSGHDYTDFVAPVHDYRNAGSDNCVIGGYVYRGTNIPSLEGYYVFADHGSNRVWAFVWDGTKACEAPIELTTQLSITGKISSFGEDDEGELYITTHQDGGLPGFLYRIDMK